jgi:hypothetical protein
MLKIISSYNVLMFLVCSLGESNLSEDGSRFLLSYLRKRTFVL